MTGQRRIPGWLAGLIGAVVLLAAWWLFSLAFEPGYSTVDADPSRIGRPTSMIGSKK